MKTSRQYILGLQIITIMMLGFGFLVSSLIQTAHAQSRLVPELSESYKAPVSTSTINTNKQLANARTKTPNPFEFIGHFFSGLIDAVNNLP